MSAGVGDDAHTEAVFAYIHDCQAGAVNGDGAFFHNARKDFRVCNDGEDNGLSLRLLGKESALPVNVPRNHMPAKTPVCRHSSFQMYHAAPFQVSQIGAAQAFRHDKGCKAVFFQFRHRQTGTVDGNAVSQLCAAKYGGCGNLQLAAVFGEGNTPNGAQFLNDACELLLRLLFREIINAEYIVSEGLYFCQMQVSGF